MLDAIKKKLGIAEMDVVEAIDAQAHAALAESFTKLQADFAEQTLVVEALTAKLVEASDAMASAASFIEAANTAKAAAIQEAKDMKMAARKAIIVANIGEGKADAFLAATEMLEDAAFEAVTGALAGSMEAEADTALFKEVGVDAKAETPTAVTESPEAVLLKKKYKAKPAK